jgi:hypothetical protein
MTAESRGNGEKSRAWRGHSQYIFLVSKVEKREKKDVRWEWKRSEKAKLPRIPPVLCRS